MHKCSVIEFVLEQICVEFSYHTRRLAMQTASRILERANCLVIARNMRAAEATD